jgi:four helix bundle protein
MSTPNNCSRKGTIVRKSYDYAIRSVNLYKYLCKEKHEFVISKQFMRCGTSVGANIRESQNAESRADFIHKLGIAQKECDESLFWLSIMKDTFLSTLNSIKV